MKKIVSLSLAVLMVLLTAISAFGYYSEAEGYTTEVEDYDYYQKFQGQGIEIDVCNWGEYVANDSVNFLDVNEDFEKLTGIKVNYTLFSSNEELYTKLKSGGASYDLIVPSDYMIGKMIGEGMIQKLDFGNIPTNHCKPHRFDQLLCRLCTQSGRTCPYRVKNSRMPQFVSFFPCFVHSWDCTLI